MEGIKNHCAVYLSQKPNLKDVGIAMVIITYVSAVNASLVVSLRALLKLGITLECLSRQRFINFLDRWEVFKISTLLLKATGDSRGGEWDLPV